MLKIKYLIYLIDWKIYHFGKAYKGMCPASYNEWLDNDYED